MTAATFSHQRTAAPSPLFWLIILLACAFVLAAFTLSHADMRHGSEAETARQCAQRPEWMFFNPATGRTALVCLTSEGKFGVYVVDELGKEVTAFLKNKMSRIEQVAKSLQNVGYGPIE